jgi:hypothetical protein
MDAQKLSRVANDILTELIGNDVAGQLANLTSHISLNTTVGYDSATEVQSALNVVFDTSVTNQYAPTYREIIQQLGATRYIGEGGKAALSQVLGGSPLTLVSNLQEYVTTFNELVPRLRKLTESLSEINIKPYESKLYEIGYVVPADLNDLSYISKRLTYYSKFISLASDIAGEEDSSVHLSRVSNGSLEFFVLGTIGVAKVVDKVLGRVVELYKELQTIKQISANIDNINANTLKTKTEALEVMLKMEKEISDKFVDETVKQVMTNYKGKKDLKGEIKGQLGVTIKTLLNDIQNGIKVEVTPPEFQETENSQSEDNISEVHTSIASTNTELIGIYSLPKEDLRLPDGFAVTKDDEKELDKEIASPASNKSTTTKTKEDVFKKES